ncbi:hypothetical protein M0802_014561 [Mischocyttarus mexicanus]|nr:hypothetical protein M0802_014561 [Mischocyttarus mexicanus]
MLEKRGSNRKAPSWFNIRPSNVKAVISCFEDTSVCLFVCFVCLFALSTDDVRDDGTQGHENETGSTGPVLSEWQLMLETLIPIIQR